MNILMICQHYAPEPFRIADICEDLVKRGHTVKVVTGTPNYPLGEIYPGYEKGQRVDEVINGVRIHRCATYPRKTGTVNRLINYFSYSITSTRYIEKLPGDFDVVLVNQLSPVMMAEAGITYKKKHHTRLVLYCLDLWPECLCAGGVKRDSAIYHVFKMISRHIYRAADEIMVASRLHMGHMADLFNIAADQISYLPQYAEGLFLNLPEKEMTNIFQLLFAGNLGMAQNLETVIDAARLLEGQAFHFHLVGDGTALIGLKKRAAGLTNVTFHGRKPLRDMPTYYAMADAMLVTLMDDPALSLTLPGKVQTYLAAGKPIVGAINGETARVLQEAQGGYCGAAGDPRALASNIVALRDSGQAKAIGRKNRAYYLRMFSKEMVMDQLVAVLSRHAKHG